MPQIIWRIKIYKTKYRVYVPQFTFQYYVGQTTAFPLAAVLVIVSSEIIHVQAPDNSVDNSLFYCLNVSVEIGC